MPPNVELVLLKQLASCLVIPMFVVGRDRVLVFYNESAEPLVGRRFEEHGAMTLDEWGGALEPSDAEGRPLSDDERPVVAALDRGEPVHRTIHVQGLDGQRRKLEATAIPLVSESQELLGALALFWQPGSGESLKPAVPVAGAPQGQHEIEAILMRRLAGYLATPIFLVGSEGQLLYFNAAAERILGRRFEDMMAVTRNELYEAFRPTDTDGLPLERGTHVLTLAREKREPVHQRFSLRGLDGVTRTVEATAFPLIGQSGRDLGAAGFFWEIEKP